MQEIIELKASDLYLLDLNFTPFVPSDPDRLDFQYRPEGKKWASILFRDTHKGHKLRIKEFFIDWFCPGYPKSLMKSFVDAYSALEVRQIKSTVYFFGKNYRSRDSVTFYSLGTTVEVESENRCTSEELLEYTTGLIPLIGNNRRKAECDFYQRSFFSNHQGGDWFEDIRVSRLSWADFSGELALGNIVLKGSGIGIMLPDRREHLICVYEDPDHNRAIWIEYLRNGSSLEHGSYQLRNGNYLYTDFNLDGNKKKWALRKGTGPHTFQFQILDGIVTAMLSPGFNLNQNDIENIGKIVESSLVGVLAE